MERIKLRNRYPNGALAPGKIILTDEQQSQWFWNRVLIVPFNECWIWLGATRKGYGRFRNNKNKFVNAHTFSYEESKKRVSLGMVLDHICCNRSCVNPQHLRELTAVENSQLPTSNCASAVNKRKTHCKRGHEFTPENTGKQTHGGRQCKACKRMLRGS